MILDTRSEFADGLAASAAAGTALVGNVMDLGPEVYDPGHKNPLYFVVQVDTTFTSGGAATVQFKLATDAQAAIATNGTATDIILSPVIPFATLVAGYKFVRPLPPALYERYMGLLVVTAAATTTAGAVSAFLTPEPALWRSVADAVN